MHKAIPIGRICPFKNRYVLRLERTRCELNLDFARTGGVSAERRSWHSGSMNRGADAICGDTDPLTPKASFGCDDVIRGGV